MALLLASPWTWALTQWVVQTKFQRCVEIVWFRTQLLTETGAVWCRQVLGLQGMLQAYRTHCLPCVSQVYIICSTWLWLHLWTLPKARNTHESAKMNWKSPEKRITQENFSISCFQLGWNQHKNSYNSIWLWHAWSQPKGRKFRGMQRWKKKWGRLGWGTELSFWETEGQKRLSFISSYLFLKDFANLQGFC